jgi:hypothetical protein
MKRKNYERPTMKVVQLQHQSQILAGSPYSMSAGGGRGQLTNGTDDLGWDEE